jgi:hypothetical protein
MPKLISRKNLRNNRSSQSFTSTVGQTSFSFSYDVGYLDVYVNGVKLTDTEFTASNGSSIVLSNPCFGGETVQLVNFKSLK